MNLISIVFNLGLTISIIFCGIRLIGVSIHQILIILFTFFIIKILLGQSKHYKNWKRCFIFSFLHIVTLFIVVHISMSVAILFTILSAFILSERCDIEDFYSYSPHVETKHKLLDMTKDELTNVFDAVNVNEEHKQVLHSIYLHHLSFHEIAERLNIEYPTVKRWHKNSIEKLAKIL